MGRRQHRSRDYRNKVYRVTGSFRFSGNLRMACLEDLLAEYYNWRGYVVKRNVKAGRRALSGWDMALDVVAYDPHKKHPCISFTCSSIGNGDQT